MLIGGKDERSQMNKLLPQKTRKGRAKINPEQGNKRERSQCD